MASKRFTVKNLDPAGAVHIRQQTLFVYKLDRLAGVPSVFINTSPYEALVRLSNRDKGGELIEYTTVIHNGKKFYAWVNNKGFYVLFDKAKPNEDTEERRQ